MSQWHLAWPWVWLLLPLPWLLWRYFPKARPSQSLALPYDTLNSTGSAIKSGSIWLWLLLTMAWFALLLAASRPQQLGPPVMPQHDGRALLMAVDLSGSMEERDMTIGGRAVTRFQAVKAVAGDFIERRHGDNIGLVLFGSQAYLVTPITFDLSAVAAQLNSSAIGIAGQQTAIGDAIGIATKRLAELPQEQRVLVLLTDGVNNSGALTPMDAAKAAKAAGVRIYTIGIGANQLQVPGLFGAMTVNPSEQLDAPLLTHIAESTGGEFFRATSTQELAAAYQAIDRLEPTPHQGKPLRKIRDRFQPALLIALLLLLLSGLARHVGRRLS